MTKIPTEEIIININVLSEVHKYLTDCDADTSFVRTLALNKIITNINTHSTLEVMDLMKKVDGGKVKAYLELAHEAALFEMPTIDSLVNEEISKLEFGQLDYSSKREEEEGQYSY